MNSLLAANILTWLMLIIHFGSADVFAEQEFELQTCANMFKLLNQRVEKQGLRRLKKRVMNT